MLSKLLRTLRSALVCTISLLAATTHAQTTINVGPSLPYSTIQSGINAAHNGDTVLVAPGTYYENIDFKGKAITVISSGGTAATIIDGGAAGPTVSFISGEVRTSVISGLTIQNGSGFATPSGNQTPEGGVYVYNSAPSIANNVITNNRCNGIYGVESGPLIQNNVISLTTWGSPANGIHPYCGLSQGAGISLLGEYGSIKPAIVSNTIKNNDLSAIEYGGAIALNGCENTLIQDNLIQGNVGSGPNGAISVVNTQQLLILQNIVVGNTVGRGALDLEIPLSPVGTPNSFVVNNLIANNTTTSTVYPIAQIWLSGGVSRTLLANNILIGASSMASYYCDPDYQYLSPTPALFYNNDVLNPAGPLYGGFCTDQTGTNGNISANPLFVNSSGNNYHLSLGSPAIDAGYDDALDDLDIVGIPLPSDFDGNMRVQNATGKGCVIDMGPYEYFGALSFCSTSEKLTSSLNPTNVGQSVTFTAQLLSSPNTPTGDIEFLDGANVLSTQPVSGTGSAAFSTSSLVVGSHSIIANYQPTGSFSATSASLTQIINGYTTSTTLTCLPSSIAVFNTALFSAAVTSINGTPTGSITFTENGATLATQALLNGSTSLNYTGSVAETQTITATYTPTGSFAASSATCSEVVTPLPTASALMATPSISLYGSAVTLSATVSPATLPGPRTPNGVVTFYDGTTAIGVVSLDASGHAILATTSLTVGTHSLTALYAGNTIYSTSTSPTVIETIQALPQVFTITLASPTITIETQHHTTTTLTLTSLNGFADSLAIVCANLPTYVTCRPTPASALLAPNGSTTVSLYLDADTVLGYARARPALPPGYLHSSLFNLALLLTPMSLLTGLATFSRRRTRLHMLLLLVAVISASLALVGCGEIIYPYDVPPSAAPGTYTIPITATGATTGITHTANLTLTVTP